MLKKLLIASVLCGLSVISVNASVEPKDMNAAQTYYEKAEYYTKKANCYSLMASDIMDSLQYIWRETT